VLAPAVYWHLCLKAKVEKLLGRKLPHGRQVKCDDTSVVASVNDPSERDLTKRFDDIDAEWSVVERQLIRWGEIFRSGKKLRLALSFDYIELAPLSSAAVSRGNKRGSSATQRMLGDRASQLDAEQGTSVSLSVWCEVYALMRYPGPPCNRGPHYQKACDATLLEMLDLEQVYEDQDPDFFIQSGVKRGIARRFVSDIGRWAEH
jgi:hypothetical protein